MTQRDAQPDLARAAIGLLRVLDLTRLAEDDDETAVAEWSRRALAAPVHPAAVCVFRQFVPAVRRALGDTVRLATVANFPAGDDDPRGAALECEQAIDAGADEVDVVLPWRALKRGDEALCADLVAACRDACGDHTLKVIVESGMLADSHCLQRAAEISIHAGADFLKTSTGKTPVGATMEAAGSLLDAIQSSGRPVGFKASGGIRTMADALAFRDLVADRLGAEATGPERFRIGASGLHDELMKALAE
ncbi:MAG: deoxyribose-phosphate aldolase [Wenzhouxiangellaceae bacterium]